MGPSCWIAIDSHDAKAHIASMGRSLRSLLKIARGLLTSAVLAFGMISASYGVQPLSGLDGDKGHHVAQGSYCEGDQTADHDCGASSSKADCCKVTGCHSVTSIQPLFLAVVDTSARDGAVQGQTHRLVGSSLAPPDHPPRAQG
jgi:hypothetical protein